MVKFAVSIARYKGFHPTIITILFLFKISGHYDKCVAQLQATFKDNVAEVTGCIFSHSQVSKKNLLLIKLIVSSLNSLQVQIHTKPVAN